MIAAAQVETTFHQEYGRILASLISQLGDFALAEDALQDALVAALERWETDGLPRSPGAWLMMVARGRAIDRLRHDAKLEYNQVLLESLAAQGTEHLGGDAWAIRHPLERQLGDLTVRDCMQLVHRSLPPSATQAHREVCARMR